MATANDLFYLLKKRINPKAPDISSMGFALGHPTLFFPKLLLTVFSLLALIRKIILCIFGYLGLCEFFEYSYVEWTATPPLAQHQSSSTIVRDMLPVLLYKDLGSNGKPDSCAFCLYEFESEEEVRRLTNCRHIFHRACLDRWIDHDQITCPLCRTCFVSKEMMEDIDTQFWGMEAAEGASDLPSEYSFMLASYS